MTRIDTHPGPVIVYGVVRLPTSATGPQWANRVRDLNSVGNPGNAGHLRPGPVIPAPLFGGPGYRGETSTPAPCGPVRDPYHGGKVAEVRPC